MIQPKRLFDSVQYQQIKFPKKDMLAAKKNGQWQLYSTAQVLETVNKLSAGLLTLGISANDYSVEGCDKIAIISSNRPEWIFVDVAVQQTGAILVPIYPTISLLELKFVLSDAAVKYIFVSNKEMLDKVNSIRSEIPTLKNIYSFDQLDTADHWTTVTKLCTDKALEQVEKIKNEINEEHTATIIYTSGTTGTPKGVMLSHKNILNDLMFAKESFPFPDAPHLRVLSFLPLNHIFEKMATYLYAFSGISIYYAESIETIGDNLKEIKPHGFVTVPRLLEKTFEKIISKGNELTGIKRKLFFWSIKLAEKYDNRKNLGPIYNIKLAIANKLIFSKWREALGNNIEFIVTGGAACQEKLLRIFNAARIPVFEGYGPTENSPVVSVNRRSSPNGTKYGTTGPPINGIEVRIAEDGEICVKGPTVMQGYYKRPDLTAETIIDGWLHTGDIGILDEGKFLKITDRKKELFKTSGGKYVAPQLIENKLKESPYIEQIIVVGAERKFVGALIVPSFISLKEWMHKNGIPFTSDEEAVENEKVIKWYAELLYSFNIYFNHVEQIKKFKLLPKEWSIDTGEMTPKMSLKRKVIMDKYKDAIEDIYK